MQPRTIHSLRTGILVAGVGLFALAARLDAAIAIDFNLATRQDTETNEPGYTPWPILDMATESKTVCGITFDVSLDGSVGTSLTTDWNKGLVQSPNFARLIGDVPGRVRIARFDGEGFHASRLLTPALR